MKTTDAHNAELTGKIDILERSKQSAAKAHEMVDLLCHGKREWMMSVPANPNHDPDLVIGSALRDMDELREENERLTEIAGDLTEKLQASETELTRLRSLYRWIPVTERLPEKYSKVNVLIRGWGWDCHTFGIDPGSECEVAEYTHWSAVPPLPSQKEVEK